MTKIEDDQAAEVMTILTALDRWLQVTDEQAHLWANVLNAKKVRLEDAQEAAYRLITNREKADATPGLLLGEIQRMRAERIRAGERYLLPPDRGLVSEDGGREVSLYPEWYRAAKRYLGDGMSTVDAMEAADADFRASRRMLGPSTKHTIGELMRGEGAE